jgi:porphobilinogen synthase
MFCQPKSKPTAIRLIQPIFVNDTDVTQTTVLGQENANHSVSAVISRIEQDLDLGQKDFLLFVTTQHKQNDCDWHMHHKIIDTIKQRFAERIHLTVDVCLCGVREDGHCCVPDDPIKTQQQLGALAQTCVDAGADSVAPSDMQPFTVATIRALTNKPIISYSTKFRSVQYAPFRQVVDSTPNSSRWYQLDVWDRDAAIKSSIHYAAQGADYLMVKPVMSSIDLIQPIREATQKLVGVYQTSSEWQSIQGHSQMDLMLQETHAVFQRAGAAFMISYGARLLQKTLK